MLSQEEKTTWMACAMYCSWEVYRPEKLAGAPVSVVPHVVLPYKSHWFEFGIHDQDVIGSTFFSRLFCSCGNAM